MWVAVQVAWMPALPAQEISFALYSRETVKTPAIVVEDLEFAITERNFRVTGVLRVGKGIRERGAPDFPDYDVILFCNLGVVRQMLEADPDYINYCPGRITVREQGVRSIITAALLPEAPDNPRLSGIIALINAQIMQIVDYGTEPWSPAEIPAAD